MTVAVAVTVAVAFLVVAGYPPTRLLTGARWASLLAAPVVSAVLLTGFAVACALVRLPVGAALVLTGLSAVGCAVAIRRAHRSPASPDSPWVLAIPLGGLVPLLTVARAPSEWDPRSIWWFHARWWAEGPAALTHAMRNPAFAFSHSDYPPLTPASVGALWVGLGTRSLVLAQVVTAVLSLSAASTLGYAVWRLFRAHLGVGRITGAAALLVAAVYGVARVAPATNGYVDFLWAATAAAAAVWLLASPPAPETLRWGAVLLAATALTKHEALIVAGAIGALALVRYARATRHDPGIRPGAAIPWVVGAVGLGVLWAGFAHGFGARSEDHWQIAPLVRLDPTVVARIGPSLSAVADRLTPVVLAAGFVTGAGWWCAREVRRRLSGSAAPWLWGAWAATVAPLAFAYVVSNRDLHWHLTSSVARTTIAPNVILLTELAIGTLTLVVARSGRGLPVAGRPESDGVPTVPS